MDEQGTYTRGKPCGPVVKRALVAALIIRDSRLLLVHNTKDGLRVEPPGGKVRAGEPLSDALRREVREETGLEVDGLVLFGEFDTYSPEGEFVVHMYLCKEVAGEPEAKEPGKISEVRWYGASELAGLKEKGLLVPNMCAALERLKGLMR